jgi:hypothetical protein
VTGVECFVPSRIGSVRAATRQMLLRRKKCAKASRRPSREIAGRALFSPRAASLCGSAPRPVGEETVTLHNWPPTGAKTSPPDQFPKTISRASDVQAGPMARWFPKVTWLGSPRGSNLPETGSK